MHRKIYLLLFLTVNSSVFASRCVMSPPVRDQFSAEKLDMLGVSVMVDLINMSPTAISQKITTTITPNKIFVGWKRTDGNQYFDPALASSHSLIPKIAGTVIDGVVNTNPTSSSISLASGKIATISFSIFCRIGWSSSATCTKSWETVQTYPGIGSNKLEYSGLSGGAQVQVCVEEDSGAVAGSILMNYVSDNSGGPQKSLSILLNGGRPF